MLPSASATKGSYSGGNGKILWDYTSSKKLRGIEQTMRFPFEGTIIDLEINTAKEGLYFLKSEEGDIF